MNSVLLKPIILIITMVSVIAVVLITALSTVLFSTPLAMADNGDTINITLNPKDVKIDYNNGTILHATPSSYWFGITKYVFKQNFQSDQTIDVVAGKGYEIIYVNQNCSIYNENTPTSIFEILWKSSVNHHLCQIENPNLNIQFQSNPIF